MTSGIRPLLLEALRSAAPEPISTVELARRIYGSADDDDLHALRVAIYNLRRHRPDLKIETVAAFERGHRFAPSAYRLVPS